MEYGRKGSANSISLKKLTIFTIIIICIVVCLYIVTKYVIANNISVTSSNGDIFEFSHDYTFKEVDATKKQYDIGDGLVYEHIAAFTDGKKVVRCALLNYAPSYIPQSQLSVASQALAYLFTEAGETYEAAVSEETESTLNELFSSYMNSYITANEPEQIGELMLSSGEKKALYKYTVYASAEQKSYFEMYFCLYSDSKLLTFFINDGNELADITSDGVQEKMDEALANDDITTILSQENVEAAIASEVVFNSYMDKLITTLGGFPTLCSKDFTEDTDGSILKFVLKTKITDSGEEITLIETAEDSDKAQSEQSTESASSAESSTEDFEQ